MKPLYPIWFDPSTMTIEQFIAYYDKYRRVAIKQRAGQCAMNCLEILRKDLANEMRGTECDPFYRDSAFPAFMYWLERRLKNG